MTWVLHSDHACRLVGRLLLWFAHLQVLTSRCSSLDRSQMDSGSRMMLLWSSARCVSSLPAW